MFTMKISKIQKAYYKDKPRFKLRNRAGAYIIFNNTKPVYVGYSGTDVYKALYRHFQSWNDTTQIRNTYQKNYNVRVIYTNTPKQAATLERLLINKYEPKDNTQKYLNFNPTNKEQEYIQDYGSIIMASKDDILPY